MDAFGYNFPFFSPTFVLPPQAGARIVKNDIKQLLLTGIGERVMRPNFGTGIRTTPFELADEATLSILRTSIIEAINQFEPRVTLSAVKFNIKPDENYLEIIVLASLNRDPNTVLDVRINVAPGNNS